MNWETLTFLGTLILIWFFANYCATLSVRREELKKERNSRFRIKLKQMDGNQWFMAVYNDRDESTKLIPLTPFQAQSLIDIGATQMADLEYDQKTGPLL